MADIEILEALPEDFDEGDGTPSDITVDDYGNEMVLTDAEDDPGDYFESIVVNGEAQEEDAIEDAEAPSEPEPEPEPLNDNIANLDTNVDVREGDQVAIMLVNNVPTVIGVMGGGDRTQHEVSDAQKAADAAAAQVAAFEEAQAEANAEFERRADAADEAIANARAGLEAAEGRITELRGDMESEVERVEGKVDTAKGELDAFKEDAEATYSTKTETDEKTGAITRTVEAHYSATAPNLSPFFSHPLEDRADWVTNDVGADWTDNDAYWLMNNKGYGWSSHQPTLYTISVEEVGEGWAHVKMDNLSTATRRFDFNIAKPTDLKPGGEYTWLFEVRNNTSTGLDSRNHFYIVQSNENWMRNRLFCGSGIKKLLSGTVSGAAVNLLTECPPGSEGVYEKRVVKLAEAPGTSRWTDGAEVRTLGRLVFLVGPSGHLEFDVRVSLYEGEYLGPYRPYRETADDAQKSYATKHELSDTADSLTSTFEATYLSKSDAEDTYTTKTTFEQDLGQISQRVEANYQSITTVSGDLEDYKDTANAAIADLQGQVDGQIEAWYYSVEPTLDNEPAKDWATDEARERHRGDIYYDVTTGHSWRWMKEGSTWQWQAIPDSDAAAALAAAQKAQGTADGKRRIFTATPVAPYDVGDLWVDGSTVKYATQLRTGDGTPNGSYHAEDWQLTATDDAAANAAKAAADAAQATADTAGNPNLTPYFSHDIGDVYNATTNPNGYWRANPTSSELKAGPTVLGDGWAHYEGDNSARTGWAYFNHIVERCDALKPSTEYTWLVEVRNLVFDAGSSIKLYPVQNNTSATQYTQTAANAYKNIAEDGDYRIIGTTRADMSSAVTLSRGYTALPAGTKCSFDMRISVYEGEYTGPYKPYVDAAALAAAQDGIKEIKTTYATKTELTTAEGRITASVAEDIAEAKQYTDGKVSEEVTNRNAAIELKAGEITSSVASTYTTKEEFAGSTRNLLAGTAVPQPSDTVWSRALDDESPLWHPYHAESALSRVEGAFRVEHAGGANGGVVVPLVSKGCVADGEKVTLSFEYRTNKNTTGDVYLLNEATPNSKQFDATALDADGEWHRFRRSWSVVGGATPPVALLVSYYKAAGTWFEVRDGSMLLERGDTTYLTESDAATVYSTKSELSQTDSSIRAAVSDSLEDAKSYADGEISKEVTARNSAIEASARGIRSEVSTNYTTKTEVAETYTTKEDAASTYTTKEDAAITFATKTALANSQAVLKTGGLGMRVNATGITGENNGECYFHGFDESFNPTDTDGWVMWNGSQLTIPKGFWINPNKVLPYNTPTYVVFRTSDSSFYGVYYDSTNKKWRASLYNASQSPEAIADFAWVDNTDVILATYVEPASEAAITNASLFDPPKRYSELADVMAQAAASAAQSAASTAQAAAGTAQAAADAAQAAANAAQSDIDNLAVGGRNLLRKSAGFTAADTCRTRSTVPENGVGKLTPTTSAAYLNWRVDYLPYSEHKEGVYTFSIDARLADEESSYANSNLMLYIGFQPAQKVIASATDKYTPAKTVAHPLTDGWVRYSATWKVPDDMTSGTDAALADGSFLTAQVGVSGSMKPALVRRPKLEKGNRATDWTPAPEDAQDSIDGLRTTITTNYYTKAEQDITDQGIRQSVSETLSTARGYADGLIETEVAERNSAIAQSAQAITLSVSEGYSTKAETAAQQPFVVGTQTAATATWTGECPELESLRDGQQITFWNPFNAAANVTLNLTLKDGTATGAIPCYYGGTTRLGTQYGANQVVHLTYREDVGSIAKGWWCDANYNTNDNTIGYNLNYRNYVLAKEAITANSLIVGDSSGYQMAAAGVSFDVDFPVLWCSKAVAANAANYDAMWTQVIDRNLGSVKSGLTGAKNATVYLAGTMDGRRFTISDDVATADPQQADSGTETTTVYLPIGRLGNNTTGANYFMFHQDSTIYAFGSDGAFQPVSYIANTTAMANRAQLSVLSDRIESVVDGLMQSSAFEQTEEGFSFSLDAQLDAAKDELSGEIEANAAEAADRIEALADDAERQQSEIAAAQAELTELSNHVRIQRNDQGMTELELGASVSPIVAVLANNGLLFRMADSEELPAYIEVDADGVARLKITEARIAENIQFGHWRFYERSNGNMSIKYVEGD